MLLHSAQLSFREPCASGSVDVACARWICKVSYDAVSNVREDWVMDLLREIGGAIRSVAACWARLISPVKRSILLCCFVRQRFRVLRAHLRRLGLPCIAGQGGWGPGRPESIVEGVSTCAAPQGLPIPSVAAGDRGHSQGAVQPCVCMVRGSQGRDRGGRRFRGSHMEREHMVGVGRRLGPRQPQATR